MPKFQTEYECQFCLKPYKLSVYIEEDLSDVLDITDCPHCNKSPEDLDIILFFKFREDIIQEFIKDYDDRYNSYMESVWEAKMDR